MARARGRRQDESLSTDRIEEAALDLIEREGLEAFSTRKLAAVLGCEAMSIYHYYPSKARLMDALFDRVVGSLPPDRPDLGWRERAGIAVAAYQAMAHRHPRFYPYVALHRHNTATGLAWLERMLSIFRDAGLDVEGAARFFRVVGYYAIGALLEETAGYGRGHSATEPVADDVVAAGFPLVAAVGRYFQPDEREATFRLGLEALLDRVADAAAAGRE